MDAFDAADHIALPVFIKQHAAIETKTIRGGAYFHGEIALASNAFALDVQGCFTRMGLKELCQTFSIQHCLDTVFHQVVPALIGGWSPVLLYVKFSLKQGRLMGHTASPFNDRAEKEVQRRLSNLHKIILSHIPRKSMLENQPHII